MRNEQFFVVVENAQDARRKVNCLSRDAGVKCGQFCKCHLVSQDHCRSL